jgi:hypothetical protein
MVDQAIATTPPKKQKTAIQKDSGVGRVFMVAGARNRRYLHLEFACV